MGRGDKRTRKGKIFMGSFGKVRASRSIIRKTANASKAKQS